MLGFLPLNDTITLKKTTQDAWGVESPNGIERFYRVRVNYSVEEKKILSTNGKELVVTGEVLFVGEVDVEVGKDVVEVEGRDYIIKSTNPMKDFGGKTIHTRVLF